MTFPPEELRLIDMTVRMFTEPRLEGDQELLCQTVTSELESREKLLSALGVSKKDLGSNAIFSRLLEGLGLDTQYKSGKNGPIPAFAKTDQFMRELLDSSDENVVALAEARLAVKSSIQSTRAQSLLDMAQRGPMPVYLSYCGAHTTRWSGGDSLNWQNLPKRGDIRRGIRAPKGYVFVKADAKQQECRILNMIAGEWDMVEAFREERDVYSELATRIFKREITKADEMERQFGKTTELGCGFGMGVDRFSAVLKQNNLDVSFAEIGVETYRSTHRKVVQLWKNCNILLDRLSGSGVWENPFGLPVTIDNGRIILPNGAPMIYHLEYDQAEKQWYRQTRSGPRKIWGGGLVENIVQALGRVAVGQACLCIKNRLGIYPVNLEHDAGVWLTPEKDADSYEVVIAEEMGRQLSWLPECPMAAETKTGVTYG